MRCTHPDASRAWQPTGTVLDMRSTTVRVLRTIVPSRIPKQHEVRRTKILLARMLLGRSQIIKTLTQPGGQVEPPGVSLIKTPDVPRPRVAGGFGGGAALRRRCQVL